MSKEISFTYRPSGGIKRILAMICAFVVAIALFMPIIAHAKTTYTVGMTLPKGKVVNTSLLNKNNDDQNFQVDLVAVYPTDNRPDNYTRVRLKKVSEYKIVGAFISFPVVWTGDKILYETDGYITIKYDNTCHKVNTQYRGVYYSFSGNNPNLDAYSVLNLKV
jgi:hypothetical protein